MGYAPHRHGPQQPLDAIAALAPGWTRWNFIADSFAPNGLGESPVRCTATARSVTRDAAGQLHDHHRASVAIDSTDMERSIMAISAHDGTHQLDMSSHIGHSVGAGFRARLAQTIANHDGVSALAEFLLDDLPGITLVAGYAFQYEDSRSGRESLTAVMTEHGDAAIDFQADTCAGWAEEATLVTFLRRDRDLLTPVGPLAPELWNGDGSDDGWAPHNDLPTDATRRVRRIDLGPATPDSDGERTFVTHFRDSHTDLDGTHRVLHEYVVTGTMRDGTITSLHPEARVLPWVECPGALASATRAVGTPVSQLRDLVRSDFRGTSTCTHLNDTLRSLQSLATMAGSPTSA